MNADLSWSEVRWRENRPSPYLHGSTAITSTLGQERFGNERSLAAHNPRQREPFCLSDHEVNAPLARMPAKSVQEADSSTTSENHESHDMAPASFDARVPSSLETRTLPSFASLQRSSIGDHSTKASPEEVHAQAKTTCHGCNERTSLLERIADAVAGLEEAWQPKASLSPSTKRERSQTDVFQTAQWIIERLHDAKTGIQKPALFSSGYRSYQPPEEYATGWSKTLTPPGPIKRSPEPQDLGYSDTNKRKRTSSYADSNFEQHSVSRHLEDQRRASDSVQRSQPCRTSSPYPSESSTSHAYASAQSPGLYARSIRPLPSPSSLANTSLKSPYTAPPGPHGSSPTISQRTSSIHTASTSSAASQHIADLQHQITLKSLALQTLQSEYTSLLQKFQRDRVKSQTFEKKTIAAEQEVNELTNKNEELSEQVRVLESQVQATEKKQEAERSNWTREKDQWCKMLEMSGRLQAKNAEERHRLVKEKEAFQHRLKTLEKNIASGASKSARSPYEPLAQDPGDLKLPGTSVDSGQYQERLAALQSDNSVLQSRLNVLRTALERIERQSTKILEKRRELLEQEEQIPGDITSILKMTTLPASDSSGIGSSAQETREQLVTTIRRESLGLPSPWRSDNTPDPSVNPPSEAGVLPRIRSPSTSVDNNASSSKRSPPAPGKHNPRLTSDALPKWQPPNTSSLHTEPLANNQRRPSGPATPYPSLESGQWEFSRQTASPPPTVESRTMNNFAHYPLPAFGVDKTPAPNYTPHHVPRPDVVSNAGSRSGPCVSMPPPPRPTAGPVPSTSAVPSPWRMS